jgi:predicted transcriptional regulator
MPEKNLTTIFGNLLCDVKELGDWGIAEGHLDITKLRLTVAARKEEAKRLVDGGMSKREAAKQLGVSHAQINKDLAGNKVSKNGNKVSTEPEAVLADSDDEGVLPDQSTVRQRYQRSLIVSCFVAIDEMTKKTKTRFFNELKEKFGDAIDV